MVSGIATLLKLATRGDRSLVVTHCPAEASNEAPSVALLSLFSEGHQVGGTFMSASDCYAMADALLQAAGLIDAEEERRAQRKAADAAKPVDTERAVYAFDFDDECARYTLPALQQQCGDRADMLAWAAQARPGERHAGTLLRRIA